MELFYFNVVSTQTADINGAIGSNYNSTSTINSVDASLNGMIEDDWPTITGSAPNSWISVTLPEAMLIPRVKVFTYEVKSINNSNNCSKQLRNNWKINEFWQNNDLRIGYC